MTHIPSHPLAELFPLIEGADFLTFTEDIRENGVREPIMLLGGSILDGRNRANALAYLAETGEVLGPGWGHRAGEPLLPEHLETDHAWFRKFNREIDGEPLAWVLSKNLKRRHLNDTQRESVAGKIANLGVGRPKTFEQAPDHIPPIGGISAQAAAGMLNVAPRQVERARFVHREGAAEVREAIDRGVIGTSAAEKIARLPEAEQPAALEKALPGGGLAIAHRRVEAADSLDFFPTPPWATRALFERVLAHLGRTGHCQFQTAWEPCCGEGHMSETMKEYFRVVHASDKGVYPAYENYDVADFLDARTVGADKVDWIITNPPFNDSVEVVLKALRIAGTGVAMFVRLAWLESVGRYEKVFRDHPPTVISIFTERVPLHRGRWEEDGTTMTAYIWLVWIKGAAPQAPFWMPPGCRDQLSKPGDVKRFGRAAIEGSLEEVEIPPFLPPRAPTAEAAE